MATKVKIDKNFPMPRDGRIGRGVYPWWDMVVGDSFEIASMQVNPPRMLVDQGWKFTKRTLPDGTKRVWRIT